MVFVYFGITFAPEFMFYTVSLKSYNLLFLFFYKNLFNFHGKKKVITKGLKAKDKAKVTRLLEMVALFLGNFK